MINFIPEPVIKIVGGFKDKVVSLFNTNTSKQTVYGREKKLSKSKREKQSEKNIIKSIINLFILEERKKRNQWHNN